MTLWLHEFRVEQLLFWRNREAAFFTFLLPVIFFLIFGSVYGDRIIENEGGIAEAHVTDITSPDNCREMVDHATRSWGRLDILDNNVGVEGVGTILDADWQQWDSVMTINVKTIALASAAALPYLSRHGGAIINISSISAFRPRGLTPYSTAKGAVIALTRAMAVDHAAAGVRVNCIAPGALNTPG